MNVLDFFKKDKPVKTIIYPGAQVAGRVIVKTEYEHEDYRTESETENDTSYADEYIKQDIEDFRKAHGSQILEQNSMMCPESIANMVTDESFPEDNDLKNLNDIFERFNFAQETRPELVMSSYEDNVVSLSSSEQTIIIQGPTGCGKSTQVPQYVLNWCKRNNKYCCIAVTQPRRIAAVTVARRVSEERGWPLGTVVGYRVGLDACVSPDTVITYMTTGVLLQQLVNAKHMRMYTHIILDEVHERDSEMDFLMLVVRKLSRTQLSRTKVILMSATIDTDTFSQYFARPTTEGDVCAANTIDGFINAPVIDVVKTTLHAVNIYTLDQLQQLLTPGERDSLVFDKNKACFNKGLLSVIGSLLKAFDKLDVDRNNPPGSVLIFLPGIFEIEDVYEFLKGHEETKTKWLLLPLHSSITVEEQKRAFEKPTAGHRKIILSTNIAESSVTVPDVVYVIDFCLTKILITDPATNYSNLKLTWASRNSCTQRAGRVGRVRSGRVYRLIYSHFYESELVQQTTPELLRSPLHRVVLLTKLLEMGPPHAILALAMDRPDLANIKQTIDVLKECGALLLTRTREGTPGALPKREWDDRDGDLTAIGRIMARLPLDIHGARLIVLGHIFGVLNECVIMAAAMSMQNIFSSPFNERMKSYTSRLSWSYGSYSDLITYLHIYNVWERHRYSGTMNQSNAEKAWMRNNYLQPRIMKEWRLLINDINYRLKRMGIEENTPGGASVPEYEKAMLIKTVICGAFYPNYFIRSSEGGQVDESDAVRKIGGRDPYTTVYFTGKPVEQPGQLYVSAIKSMLKDCATDIKVTFDSGSSGKIYAQFPKGTSGADSFRIAAPVYRAVKYRLLHLPTVIQCLSAEEGRRRLETWRIQQERNTKIDSTHPVLPPSSVSNMVIIITYVSSPSDFYVFDKSNLQLEETLQEIEKELNSKELIPVTNPAVGLVYVAPYEDDYYRARLLSISQPNVHGKKNVDVYFIDYGNTATISSAHLYGLPNIPKMHHPPLALHCTLAHVRPPITMTTEGNDWPKESIERFKSLCVDSERNPLFACIYSVVENVCVMEIQKRSNNPSLASNETINDVLVRECHARPAIESFLSQEDHTRRQRIQSQIEDGDDNSLKSFSFENDYGDEQNIPPPSKLECRRTMSLRGPFSPLETKVYGLTQNGQLHSTNIDHGSVNCVLLDTDPQDPHDRLLVAGSINTNADRTTLNLRHTTLMPSIPGFPMLMGMLWAPRTALHTDRDKTRITSILCGVGYNENTHRPLLHIHDIVFNVDFEVTPKDVRTINEIREYMNQAMHAINSCCLEEPSQYSIESCQLEIRNRIRDLLRTHRQSLERTILPQNKSWSLATFFNMDLYSKDIWPPHATPRELDDSQRKQVVRENEIFKQIETLESMAERRMPTSAMTCDLCNFTVYEIHEVRAHLADPAHKRNVIHFETSVKN